MSTLLLLDLARESAVSNSRLAETIREEVRQLAELQGQGSNGEALRRRAVCSARGATQATLSRTAEVLNLWHQALAAFGEGLSGEQSTKSLELLRNAIDSWLALARACRDVWRIATA